MCLVNELRALTQLQAENETACFTLSPSQLDPFSGKTETRTSLAVIEIFMELKRADDFGPHQTMQLLKSGEFFHVKLVIKRAYSDGPEHRK